MSRVCESCPNPIPAAEPSWKTLCGACYAKSKRGSGAPPRKASFEPAPAPNLFSPLRTAVEDKGVRRPAPFGSVRELMDFYSVRRTAPLALKHPSCVWREKTLR